MHLTISERGTFIQLKGERLQFRVDGKLENEIALRDLETLTVTTTAVSITLEAIKNCAKFGIQIDLLDFQGDPYAKITSPYLVGTVSTRRAQMVAYLNEKGLEVAKHAIRARLKNQTNLLRYFGKYRREASPEVFAVIEEAIPKFLDLETELNEIQADKVQLGVALRVLMQNALEALATGGRIEVKLELGSFASQLEANALPSIAKIAPATTSPQPSAAITVSDDGPGMSDEALRHCFDPFYSGREAGRGLGLGLSKVWRIVQLHQGQISVASQPGYGTTFTLVLPMAGPGTK